MLALMPLPYLSPGLAACLVVPSPELIHVDVADDIDAPGLEDTLHEAAVDKLTELEVEGRGDEEHPWAIAIDVTGEAFFYSVALALSRAETPLDPQPERFECECNTEELVARIDGALVAAVTRLRETGDLTSSESPDPSDTPVPPPPIERPDERTARPLGPLGKAGIATSVVGGAALAAGLGLALAPDAQAAEFGAEQQEPIGLRRGGYAAIGLGSAALLTGIALIIVDRVRAKKHTARRSSALFTFAWGR